MLHKARPHQQMRHIWTFKERLKTFESICQQSPEIFGVTPKCARDVYLSKLIFIEFGKLQKQDGKAETAM